MKVHAVNRGCYNSATVNRSDARDRNAFTLPGTPGLVDRLDFCRREGAAEHVNLVSYTGEQIVVQALEVSNV